jgi:hypothetical protein
MFDANLESGLLVDLSDDQQQLVTGGGSVGDELRDKLMTHYKANYAITDLQVAQQSGPNGSTNLQAFKHDTIDLDTAAMKELQARLS